MASNGDIATISKPVSNSVERFDVPEWVLTTIGVQRNELSVLNVNTQSSKLYEAIVRYAAQRAVDIGEKAPTKSDRVPSNLLKEAREYPGRLSILQHPPDKAIEPWRYWRRPVDFDSDENEEEEAARTYTVGQGWARLKTNAGSDVVFQHFSCGEPRTESRRLSLYRVIVLYGASEKVLKDVCSEAIAWDEEREQAMIKTRPGKYVLYTLLVDKCNGVEWKCHGHRKSRPMSSIILRDDLAQSIADDATSFLNKETKKWYHQHGLPYRRNYLFFGTPGCGKTSMIRSLAGIYSLKACFMSLTHEDFNDHFLVEALAKIPRPSILIFEDVDALFEKRQGVSKSNLTFSGLLNAVDGMVSTDGVMLVMTTNHRDLLDAALMRCGRVDRQFEFAPPGHEEIFRYFLSFYPDAKEKQAEKFADAVMGRSEENARSIATLQQHFIQCRGKTAEDAIQNLDYFFTSHFKQGKEEEIDLSNDKNKALTSKKRKNYNLRGRSSVSRSKRIHQS